jgi:thiamine-phosphate pyrophosphorylase
VPELSGLVGAGDVLSALVGACCAVAPDPSAACRGARALFQCAARAAARRATGPASLWLHLVDALGTLTPQELDGGGRVGTSAMTDWTEPRLAAALRLYLLADTGLVPPDRLPAAVAAAIRGGVTAVQLRAKDATTLEYLELARALRAVCTDNGVPFIVNDRVDVALAAEADGAHVGHVGEEDLTPKDARRLLGPDAIVGVSVGSAPEARVATSDGASYVSAGPMFSTTTKANAGPAAGEALLRAVRAATRLPLVVIGGITAERAGALYAAGADGLCVGAAILRPGDPAAAARAFAAAAAEHGRG